MFAGDSQILRNKRHFVISVIAINVFYCKFNNYILLKLTKSMHQKTSKITINDIVKEHTQLEYEYLLLLRRI